MIDVVEAVGEYLKECGYTVDRTGDSWFVDIVYGPRSFEYTVISVYINDGCAEVYPPGTACLLFVSLADPSSLEMISKVLSDTEHALKTRGIQDVWDSGWRVAEA